MELAIRLVSLLKTIRDTTLQGFKVYDKHLVFKQTKMN